MSHESDHANPSHLAGVDYKAQSGNDEDKESYEMMRRNEGDSNGMMDSQGTIDLEDGELEDGELDDEDPGIQEEQMVPPSLMKADTVPIENVAQEMKGESEDPMYEQPVQEGLGEKWQERLNEEQQQSNSSESESESEERLNKKERRRRKRQRKRERKKDSSKKKKKRSKYMDHDGAEGEFDQNRQSHGGWPSYPTSTNNAGKKFAGSPNSANSHTPPGPYDSPQGSPDEKSFDYLMAQHRQAAGHSPPGPYDSPYDSPPGPYDSPSDEDFDGPSKKKKVPTATLR